jgi:N-methylhydantoinase A
VLNRIGDGALLGGKIRVDAERARDSFVAAVEKLDFPSAVEAAEGALQVLVARTIRAIREISLERGFDPREFSLLAFGGAGPMHAAHIAEELGIETVVIPNHPGNFSALGLVVANVREDLTSTYLARSSVLDLAALAGRLTEMGEEVRRRLLEQSALPESVSLSYFLEMRCLGQAHEISVPMAAEPDRIDLPLIENAFRETYEERYGRPPEAEAEFEIITLRAIGEGQVQALPAETWHSTEPSGDMAPRSRQVWFSGQWRETSVWGRPQLSAGTVLEGPALIEENGATTVIPPDWTGRVHPAGHILLRRMKLS